MARFRVLMAVAMVVTIWVGPAAAQPLTIGGDANGGDCPLVGVWSAGTSTCTLTRDVSNGIVLRGLTVALEGNGHRLVGVPTSVGVAASEPVTIAIRNLTVSGFGIGFNLQSPVGLSATLTGNTLISNGVGLQLFAVTGTIERNVVWNNDVGVYTMRRGTRSFRRNLIARNRLALWFDDDTTSVFTGNTFERNAALLRITDFAGPVFSRNNFVANGGPEDGGFWGGPFNRPSPDGGNYWSDYHTPAQGCVDGNVDGFCDAPFVVRPTGPLGDLMQDELPWTVPSGWVAAGITDLRSETARVCGLGWIASRTCKSLDLKLRTAEASIQRGYPLAAAVVLKAYALELALQRGRAVNDAAYALLFPKVQAVLEELI